MLQKPTLLKTIKRFNPKDKIARQIANAIAQEKMLPRFGPLNKNAIGIYKVPWKPLINIANNDSNKEKSIVQNKKALLSLHFHVNVKRFASNLKTIKFEALIANLGTNDANIFNILTMIVQGNLNKNNEDIISILNTLRNIFESKPPNIETAKLFLLLWDHYEIPFEPLNFKKEIQNTKTEDIIQEKRIKKEKPSQEHLENSIRDIKENILKFQKLFIYNDEKLIIDIDNDLLQKWLTHIEMRDNLIYLLPEEKEINNKLKDYYEKNIPSKDSLLNTLKDNLKYLKEKSTLSNDFKENSVPIITLSDYLKEIKNTEDLIHILMQNEKLSVEDIKLLAIKSTAATIDDEGTFKLKTETYQYIMENTEIFCFQFTEYYPDINLIKNKIKDKEFFILKENTTNSVINLAHMSHKTLVIYDDINDKNILIKIGMLTSTKDDTTIVIDNYQQTNPDIEKQNKKQCFRVFSAFIITDSKEELTFDIETTLFFHNLNSNGEDISKKLIKAYEEKEHIWSKKPYQYSYEGNEEFLRKIALIFLEKELKILKKEYMELNQRLNTLYYTDEELYREECVFLEITKQNIILEKQEQQFNSLLPSTFKLIQKALKIFELKSYKDNKKIKKEELKKLLSIKQDQETQNRSEVKTAKEKKEDYLKQKKEKNEQTYNDE